MNLPELLVYGLLAIPFFGAPLLMYLSRRNTAVAASRFSPWAQRRQFAPSPLNALERAMQLTAFSRSDGRFAFVENAASSSRSGRYSAQTLLRWTSTSRTYPGGLHVTVDPALGGGRPLPSYPALLAFAQSTGLPYIAYATYSPNFELSESVLAHVPRGQIRAFSVGGSEISLVIEEQVASEECFDAFLSFVAGLSVEGTTLVWRPPANSPFRG